MTTTQPAIRRNIHARFSLRLHSSFSSLLTACNSAKKPSDTNFTKAINQYLAKHGEGLYGDRSGVSRGSSLNRSRGSVRYWYADGRAGTGWPGAFERYDGGRSWDAGCSARLNFTATRKAIRTDCGGQKYFQQIPGIFGQTVGFCYGQKSVDSIVKWTEPVTMGASSQTEVTYTYKIVDLAPWAERSEVQQRFRRYASDSQRSIEDERDRRICS